MKKVLKKKAKKSFRLSKLVFEFMTIAVVRIRGTVGVRKDIDDTLKMLGLKKPNTLALLPDTEQLKGMIRKVENFVAWGEVNEDIVNKLKEKGETKVFHLKPPAKGYKSVKHRWPKGDLGYRGRDIEKLIEKMI